MYGRVEGEGLVTSCLSLSPSLSHLHLEAQTPTPKGVGPGLDGMRTDPSPGPSWGYSRDHFGRFEIVLGAISQLLALVSPGP